MMIINDSVSPMVATEAEPSRPAKKTSTTAKMLSISISITIGTARRKIERPMGPSV